MKFLGDGPVVDEGTGELKVPVGWNSGHPKLSFQFFVLAQLYKKNLTDNIFHIRAGFQHGSDNPEWPIDIPMHMKIRHEFEIPKVGDFVKFFYEFDDPAMNSGQPGVDFSIYFKIKLVPHTFELHKFHLAAALNPAIETEGQAANVSIALPYAPSIKLITE